jgi:hypothetical protein
VTFASLPVASAAGGVVVRPKVGTVSRDVPEPIVLEFVTVIVTCLMVAGSVGALGATPTVVGVEPDQLLPSYVQAVFTWKLAGLACRPVIVYVTTSCCDAVAEQLCGVRVSGVVLEPPSVAGIDASVLDSDGRCGCPGTGEAAPPVITTSR